MDDFLFFFLLLFLSLATAISSVCSCFTFLELGGRRSSWSPSDMNRFLEFVGWGWRIIPVLGPGVVWRAGITCGSSGSSWKLKQPILCKPGYI